MSDEGHRTNDRAVGLMHAARFGEDHHENVSSWCRLRHCCGLHLTSIRSSELPKRDLAGSLLRLRYLCEMSARVALRAGMTASRLVPVEHAIPALTDHVEDNGGVIGLRIGGRGGGFFNAAIGRPFWKWPKHGTLGALHDMGRRLRSSGVLLQARPAGHKNS